MRALDLTQQWPVPNVSAAVVVVPRDGSPVTVDMVGDPQRAYRLASIAKPMSVWAILVAVEEGLVSLDQPVGQPGCTLRHLLSHAGGYPFDGPEPIAPPERRRIYSNTGIEMAADLVAEASGMTFADYLRDAVFEPLGMGASHLRGSPAHQIWSTLDDTVRFAQELIAPRLVSRATASEAEHPVFPELGGIVPGVGRYDHCAWGLGLEIKGDKDPHWTGRTNSAATFGHFGGAGTLLWVDVGAFDGRAVACIALTDRLFDEWADEALVRWPELSDAVLDDVRATR
ncbi:MAG: serine hydrolase domain-containing protein [Ilumatobacteraceae bacterium]